MAGIHQFTSSQWIQSGSQADFKSGIIVSKSFDVEGTINATSFTGDGSGLTGVGATFFAGSGSGISASTPVSTDHVIQLGSGQSMANVGDVSIETTSSGWVPNYYNFIRILDRFNTVQSGSKSYYTASNESGDDNEIDPNYNSLAPGVHRYLVYAAKTGSGGQTDQIYTTVYIKGFINVPPTIVLPTGEVENSPVTLSMVHDTDSLEYIAYFTNSLDTNITEGDFVRVYSASRDTTDPENPTVNTAKYNFQMDHHQTDIEESDDFIGTGSYDNISGYVGGYGEHASALPTESLVFTASITDYTLNNGTWNWAYNIGKRDEEFRIRMLDNNNINSESISSFTMSVFPPPTASISNLRLQFESGSYTFEQLVATEYTTSILYGTDTATRTNRDNLPKEYTSSLVGLRVLMDINEPPNYTPSPHEHFTTVRISSCSLTDYNNANKFNNPSDLYYFRFSGSGGDNSNVQAFHYDTAISTDPFTNTVYDTTNGYGLFSFKPGSWVIGWDDSVTTNIYNLNYIQHGTNHHTSQLTDIRAPIKLEVNPVEQIQISNVTVEVEDNYGSDTGTDSRTATILYGYDSSSIDSDTGSFENHVSGALYISSSFVRYRLKYKVTEPFGPHHEPLKVIISSSNEEYESQYTWHTSSTNDVSSDSGILDEQNRLVTNYTSSWLNKAFGSGSHEISASFSTSSVDLNTTLADYDITGATITIDNTTPTEITDIVYETENSGSSEIPVTDTIRTVLFGSPHYTIANTSSFHGHYSSSTYASQSLSRFRIRAKIVEPLGPHHTQSRFEKKFVDDASFDDIIDTITFSTSSADVENSSSYYNSNNRFVSHYTSSWIGQQLSVSDNSSTKWDYLSGSIQHNDTDGIYDTVAFTTASGQTSSIVVYDTPQVKIEDYFFETEGYGYSASDATDIGVSGNQIRTILYGDNHQTNDGTGSVSWKNHESASLWASHSVTRGRLRLKVTEPVGPAIAKINITPNWETNLSTLYFYTGSTDSELSNSYYENNKLVVHYTSSWIGKTLNSTNLSGINKTFNQSTIATDITNENGLDVTTPTTTTMNVYDTPKTKFEEFETETETFGYSDIETNESMRTILYGDNITTNATSASTTWENQRNSGSYASHSVSRFRYKVKITEPVGHLIHTASNVDMTKRYSTTPTLLFNTTFGTASLTGISSSQSYWSDTKEFITVYTSSWVGEALNTEQGGNRTWYISTGSVNHNPSTETGFTTASFTETTLVVNDTAPTQIIDIVNDTEEYGYSNSNETDTGVTSSMRNVLYGDAHVINGETGSLGWENHVSASTFASHSVARFRLRVKVVEPVGPLHNNSVITQKYSMVEDDELGNFRTYTFNSSSTNFGSGFTGGKVSKSYYDTDDRFVSEYTTSWIDANYGINLRDTNFGGQEYWRIATHSITHNPTNENSYTTNTQKTTSLLVVDTATTKISNLMIETETFGESGIGQNYPSTNLAHRTILYGKTTSEETGSDWPDNPEYTASSVTRFRILADVEEPIGFHHNDTTINYNKDNQHTTENGNQGDGVDRTFNTSSDYNISWVYNTTNRLIASYTSSWINEALAPSYNNTQQQTWKFIIQDADVEHSPSGETGREIIGSLSDADNYIAVSASNDVKVENWNVEVEQFPYSSSVGVHSRIQKLLYGQTTTLRDTIADTIGDIWSGSANVRYRVLADIIEPKGPQHKPMDFRLKEGGTIFDTFTFQSGALKGTHEDIEFSSSGYNENNEYTASYTSSWYGGSSTELSVGDHTITSDVNNFNPVGEFYTDGLTGDTSPSGDSDASVTIQNHDNTQIKNIKLEVEGTKSGSNVGTDTRTTTILHGKTGSEDDNIVNDTYPYQAAKEQLTSIRVLADIEEPFGPLHAKTTFKVDNWSGGPGNTEGSGTGSFYFYTGSTYVSSSASLDYIEHGSQSVSYTSSWLPITLWNSDVIPRSADVSIGAITHDWRDDLVTENPTIGNSDLINTITINIAPSASVYTVPETSSTDTDWSSSVDLAKYVTYEGTNIVVGVVSGISGSVSVTSSVPTASYDGELAIKYSENLAGDIDVDDDFTWTSIDTSTGSLTIDSADMANYTEVKEKTVYISGSDILHGNGSSSNNPFTFNIVPAKPQSIDNQSWGSSTGITHGSTGISVPEIYSNRRLYTAALAGGLGYYKADEQPGTTVENVVIVTASDNYSMSFTPFTPEFTGNYTDNDRAFDFGDSGSLIVKISGSEVVNVSLQDKFTVGDKDGDQTLGNYNGDGWTTGTASFGGSYANKGRLILTKVSPFNNVSQSIYSGDTYYRNGYQGWTARIEIDDKLNDGHNVLEFSHSIDGTTTQSWQPFEWYYDDGFTEPTISIDNNPTMSWEADITNPTFSLSGVSFFEDGKGFLVNFKNRILGLANKSYREQAGSNNYVVKIDPPTDITVKTGSLGVGTFKNIDLDNPTTLYGFKFHDKNMGDLVPNYNSSGSFEKLQITASNVDSNVSSESELSGSVYGIEFKVYERNAYDDVDEWGISSQGVNIPIGRFIDVSDITETHAINSKTSTTAIEDFYNEDYRWYSSSVEDSASFNFNKGAGSDYGTTTGGGNVDGQIGYKHFWIDGMFSGSLKSATDVVVGPDFAPSASIANIQELQQHFNGRLIYPTINYTQYDNVDFSVVNPSAPDYSSATGDRYYYRALECGNGQLFYLYVYTPGSGETPDSTLGVLADDMKITSTQLADPAVTIDSRDVRIDLRIPGGVTADSSNDVNNPGSLWQNACAHNQGTYNYDVVEKGLYNSFGSYGGHETNAYRIRVDWGTVVPNYTAGVVLVRIRIKNGYTKVITGIKIEPT